MKYGSWYIKVQVNGTINYFSLHQIRFISAVRLNSKISTLSEEKSKAIRLSLKKLINL